MKLSRMKLTEHVTLIEKMRNANKIIVRRPEGKILRGPTWHVCQDNIKMELKENGVRM
jgi:hypothetical protein